MVNRKEIDVAALQRQERERLSHLPVEPVPSVPPTIHWTQLAEAAPGSRIATEWNVYRRQVGQLLAAGHAGRWVLIVGEEIVGVWDAEAEARAVRAQRFPQHDVLLHQILERDPLLRGGGYQRVWPS